MEQASDDGQEGYGVSDYGDHIFGPRNPPQNVWQQAYEARLIKARRSCEDAREALRGIGASSRKGTVDRLINDLRLVETTISALWMAHYGPEEKE